MKNIKKIFCSDMKAIFGHFLVLVIALALCVLPALYAWFNIYSNWDPYGNTDDIKIAVSSNDEGYTDKNGENINVGADVLKTLKKEKAIHWVFTDSEKAKKGVKSGKYYAAIVFSKDFSECMYNGFMEGLKRPKVTYYENEKKNAIAPKITDSAVNKVETKINKMYMSIVVSNVLEKESEIANPTEDNSKVKKLQKKIKMVNRNMQTYSATVDSLVSANKKLTASMQGAQSNLDAIKSTTQNVKTKINKKPEKATTFSKNLLQKDKEITKSFSSAAEDVKQAIQEDTYAKKTTYYNRAVASLKDSQKNINDMIDALKRITLNDTLAQSRCQTLIASLESQNKRVDTLLKQLSSGTNKDSSKRIAQELEEQWQASMDRLQQNFVSVLTPLVKEVSNLTDTVVKDVSNAADSITQDLTILNGVLNGATTGLDSLSTSFTSLSDVLKQVSNKLTLTSEAINGISDSELVQKLTDFMKGDPEKYGEFFASPIKIETKAVYPVKNYGSGVTPFYTTLALWVGGIFLVSLIKVKPNPEKFANARPHELFLGRFILFFLLGQLQTLIIVWGNLYLLHVQCLYPKRFLFAASITSFTFMLLLYALTVSFGDIGKALIVVFVVIQIAGSSGTYPIEILPEFYQKVYLFFPFPYAINAMREAICGMNGNDFVIYLLQLLAFAVAALLLGLVIRLPFVRLYHFMERRMEDTGMM